VARHASSEPSPNRQQSFTEPSPGRLTELGLLILAWIIVSAFYVLASLGAQGHLPDRLGVFLTTIVAISLALHVAIRYLAPNASQILLPIATLLNGIGYVEIARWNPLYAGKQVVWFLISAIALVATLIVVRRVRDLDRYRYLTLLAALTLLVLPLIPHFGENIGGARLWVVVGPISFQPVEIAKILLVFFFASYFAANRELLSTPTLRIGPRQIVPPKVLMPILIAWGISIAILGAENDIGFAMLLFALFISMLWVTTGLKTYVVLGIGLFGGGLYVAARFFTQVHARFTLWFDPWQVCHLTTNCQIADGWYSIAAGGATGTGLGLGQSGNIPLLTTDMIFAAIAEELGFLGIILVVCLFSAFVGEGFRIAQRATSDYVRLAASGLSALMGFQAFFIMAGILRLLPFTGITLPFVAYGGSSLFANYLIVALLLRISDEEALERRGGEIVAVKFKGQKAVSGTKRRS
jgi:cell division protein FtsW (lipid II flippase)